jgi:hypothetical protein
VLSVELHMTLTVARHKRYPQILILQSLTQFCRPEHLSSCCDTVDCLLIGVGVLAFAICSVRVMVPSYQWQLGYDVIPMACASCAPARILSTCMLLPVIAASAEALRSIWPPPSKSDPASNIQLPRVMQNIQVWCLTAFLLRTVDMHGSSKLHVSAQICCC